MQIVRRHPYSVFFALSVGAFFVATVCADVLARVRVGAQDFSKAANEHFYYAFIQPVGTAMLLAPFLLLAWMSASLAKRRGHKHGLGLFALGAALLCLLYFSGYYGSQTYMERRLWTAAALSVGLLPFKSVLVLVFCFGVRWFVVRKKSGGET
jgi:hypothetical protein